MAGLPEEIITQILYYVPAKSIGRFRSVSKGWRSLFTHPDFIKSHQNALNKLHLIFSNIPGCFPLLRTPYRSGNAWAGSYTLMYGHVYSLKTNTWKQLTDHLDEYRSIYSKLGSVFVDGFLHWFATKSVNGLELTVILAFSLADDKFSEVTLPEFVESNEYLSSDYCRLVVLGGKLALFHGLNGEIWLMNVYRIKESWTKILLHGIPTVTPHPCNKPMVFCHDGKFMVANSDRMMVYDDEKETFEETVCVWDPANLVNGSYVESLVSIASCIEQ